MKDEDDTRTIVEAMLTLIDAETVSVTGNRDRFTATIGGAAVALDGSQSHTFERLASMIEARIAYERARAMVVASGEEGVPLWLVTGSTVLAAWLEWSHIGASFSKTLVLADHAEAAPVTGEFSRRARRDLGQMAAKIRVRAGQAVAELIELSHRAPAVMTLGERAYVRVLRQQLPDTVLQGLGNEPGRNDRRRAKDIVDHPLFAARDIMVAGVRQDRHDVVVELETEWAPLAPIPDKAWTAVPRDADHRFPSRATAREVADLYALAKRGERLLMRQTSHDIITRRGDPR